MRRDCEHDFKGDEEGGDVSSYVSLIKIFIIIIIKMVLCKHCDRDIALNNISKHEKSCEIKRRGMNALVKSHNSLRVQIWE